MSNHRSHTYLPAKTLDSLNNIEMIAKGMVEGAMTGLHRSPYHGFSSEFAEYRKYCPGDAVRYVDWMVYAKSDRYYIKQFEEETNTRSYIVLDNSNSMRLKSDKLHKFNYSCYLAAAFMYLMQRQRDAVGLFTYSEQVNNFFPAKTSLRHLRFLLSELEKLNPSGASNATAAFHRIAETVHRRSLVIIFSDFFDPNPEFIKSLEHFRYKQCEVILFQVLDVLESDFPYKGLVEFKDLETGETIEVESRDHRKYYLNDLQEYNKKLKEQVNGMNITIETLTTASSFEKALLAYFYKREKLI